MVLTVQMTDKITQLNHGSDLSKLSHEIDKGNDLFIKTSYALETMLNNPDKHKSKHLMQFKKKQKPSTGEQHIEL